MKREKRSKNAKKSANNAKITPNNDQIMANNDQISPNNEQKEAILCNGEKICKDTIMRVPAHARLTFEEDLVNLNRSEFAKKWNHKLNSFGLFHFS